jgi:hypothetical protein
VKIFIPIKFFCALFFCSLLIASPVCAFIGEIHVDVTPEKQAPAPPEDRSALWIRSGTRATLLVIDSKHRRTGVDYQTHKTLEEIPHSECETDFIENQYTGEPYSEVTERMTMRPAAKGVYELHLTGLQAGPYQVVIAALDRNGSSLPEKDLDGLISEGQKKVLRVTFDPSSDSILTVVEQAPH